MSKQKSRYESRNSTCRDADHDWMSTAAATYRVCKREKCRASERLVDGQWISNARAYKFHDPVVETRTRQRQPRQVPMWESGH